MSSDLNTNRNMWIAGSIGAIVLFTVIFFSSVRLLEKRSGGARIGHRSPIAELAYCGPEDQGLCIVSFSQMVDGALQVSFQVPYAYYPKFILVIDRYGVESTYECQREEELPTAVTCIGPAQVPGEVLQFIVISKSRSTVLAEGKFSIIGIALPTPEISPTATLEGMLTETPTSTPFPGTPFPTRTPTIPSYPNPSYPNPSYP